MAFDPRRAVVLKEGAGTAVYRATMCGREVVLKEWELRSLGARFKALVGQGRADRHWRGAAWLAAHGIRTATPLVLAHERGAASPRQWLVMEWLPGKSVLEHMADDDLPAREQHALAAACGALVARLYVNGRFNRDGKPSNLIATRTGLDPQIAVIDCVAIRRILLDDDDKLERMFASLYIEAMGCGHAPRRSLAMAALRGCSASVTGHVSGPDLGPTIEELWRVTVGLIQSHGNAVPEVDPLKRPDT